MRLKKFYDGEKLFDAYCEMGAAATMERLAQWAREHDMYNPDTGAVSQTGPWYSMFRWMFEHPEESYPKYKKLYFEKNPTKPPLPFCEPEAEWDYVRELHDYATRNAAIAGRQKYEKFRQRYKLSPNIKINRLDVVQVTDPRHFMYQRFLAVENYDGQFVEVREPGMNGRDVFHQFKPEQIALTGGKAII